MGFNLGARQRLTATIAIYFAFFASELAVALHTRSLALTADAFHYMNDLIGLIVALIALIASCPAKDRERPSRGPFSFGWQRAPVIGAFFNGAFLLALGVSIFFQSVERFIGTPLAQVDDTISMLIMGCVGLALNIISIALLHQHPGHGHCHGHVHPHASDLAPGDSSSVEAEEALADSLYRHLHGEHRHFKQQQNAAPKRDLGMLGVLIHVICDALNNLGVILAAVVMAYTTSVFRFYADPAVSMGISIMILLSACPLIKDSGAILLQGAPRGLDVQDVQEDLEMIPGIESVHELHVWQLTEEKTIATAHLIITDPDLSTFMLRAKIIQQCLHAHGIHSSTLQHEFLAEERAALCRDQGRPPTCQMICSAECESIGCCVGIPDADGAEEGISTAVKDAALETSSSLDGDSNVSTDRLKHLTK
ncbi:cation efflux family-domain-containing protein [Lasiosphaeris hirsuta]|uniref:Cation efflux family-domain-containing protein n=1 Tax=Lasiosphaeris hirsuta TaxID=260670 RepID=A0AA40AH55_9PEZI|nr:cation efflux family-domain-containing protein [Lasiosphaeris hirsuta]